uniref:CCHC-type domain-containing protein n=1 Tax=Strongyloides papillosus TaxID=174720 RepID=A0A0N5BQL0_STREA
MERLNRANRGGNGLKPLHQFMNPEDKNPTALVEVLPDIIERENLREELKDRFERLLHQPLGNSLYTCYRKWRAVSPGCQFGYLIKVVKAVYEKYVKNNFNLRAMRGWKQRMDEAVRDYNLRYRNKLAEIYPDNENSLYRKAMTEAERGDYWRVEIVNTYIASLTKELREKMPIIPDHAKCLETAMTIAENYEKELDDREAKQELIERMNKAGTRRVLVGKMSQPAEYSKDRKSLVCHNCGFKGHLKNECRRPPVACQHCGKSGHLIQYCYGKRPQPRGKSNSSISKIAAASLAVIMTLILGVLGILGEEVGAEKYHSEPMIVTDIFKVTNHEKGCQIVRFIPMMGDGMFFYPTKGLEKISFIAGRSNYAECQCDYRKDGFRNPHTNDCYVPMNTTVSFNGEAPVWEQLEMELFAGGDPRGIHWLAWNEYVLSRIKANHPPADINSVPYAHLQYYMNNGITDQKLKELKVKHIAKYEEMKKKVDAGPEEAAINLELDREELRSEIDLAIQEHREGEDPFENYSTFTKSNEDRDFEDSAETAISRGSTRYESVISATSGGKDPMPRGMPSARLNIVPQIRTPIANIPFSTSPSIIGSIGNYPLRTTDLAKELKAEELKKSLYDLIEKSKENDVKGVVDALMNSFNVAEGMEAIGVLAVCVSVILGAYYKRRVVNDMISSVLKRIRGRAEDEYSVHASDHRPRTAPRQISDTDEESLEMQTLERKGSKYKSKSNSEKKRDLELCDTDVLPFDEDDEKLREAAIQAGYALMTQVFIDDGSDVSLISEEQWILFGSPPVEPTDAWVDNTHDRIKFKGVTLLKVCTVNLRETEERFYIVPDLTLNIIIGRTFLSKYSKYVHNYEKHTVTIGNSIIPKAWADPHRNLVLVATANTTLQPGKGMNFH